MDSGLTSNTAVSPSEMWRSQPWLVERTASTASYGSLRVQEYAWSANADQFGSDIALLVVTIQGKLNFQVGGIFKGL